MDAIVPEALITGVHRHGADHSRNSEIFIRKMLGNLYNFHHKGTIDNISPLTSYCSNEGKVACAPGVLYVSRFNDSVFKLCGIQPWFFIIRIIWEALCGISVNFSSSTCLFAHRHFRKISGSFNVILNR